jgi:hypothetical protein
VGAVVGGAVSYGTQVVGNLQHGQSLGSALTHVDVAEIGKAAFVGLVIGGTGGLATAGLGAVGLGGVAAGVGGRVVMGAVEGGGAQIGDNLLHGRSWNDGVGGAMVIGAATGGLSPLGGAALRQVTKRFGSEAVADGETALKGTVCGLSFSADTKVATPQGPRPIASIKPGDKVLAYDPETKRVTTQSVERVFVNHDSDRVDVTLDTTRTSDKNGPAGAAVESATETHGTETIHTTANHPWLTADRGWVDAGALQIGEPVELANGSLALVESLRNIPGVGTMYDLSLEQVHTFEVGDGAYVVHNCSGSVGHGPFRARGGGVAPPDEVSGPYRRPSGATTDAQRASVQGRPCIDCGSISPRQVADHIFPLVREFYETGRINMFRMRSLEAVQPQCPFCSARQGGLLSSFSRQMRRLFLE